MRKKEHFSDFSNVEARNNYIIPEDLPEGPYGSPRGKNTPVENKSTPWGPEQRSYSAFNYNDKTFHENLPRNYPGAHPTHDEDSKEIEAPFSSGKKDTY